MIKIGGKPILWHIMKIFSHYNINEFIICCGYKHEIIKEYFENISEKWSVEVVDTGLDTMTGGRIKRIEKYLNNEKFFLLYGDDLKPVNITELLNFHIKNKKLVTVTAAQPPGRFGILKLEEHNVVEMREKPPGDENWINGGYYVLEPEIFNYISKDSDIWESGPLNNAKGLGLDITRERLRHMYGEDARLILGDRPSGGCVATIHMPFHPAGDSRSNSDLSGLGN